MTKVWDHDPPLSNACRYVAVHYQLQVNKASQLIVASLQHKGQLLVRIQFSVSDEVHIALCDCEALSFQRSIHSERDLECRTSIGW